MRVLLVGVARGGVSIGAILRKPCGPDRQLRPLQHSIHTVNTKYKRYIYYTLIGELSAGLFIGGNLSKNASNARHTVSPKRDRGDVDVELVKHMWFCFVSPLIGIAIENAASYNKLCSGWVPPATKDLR